MKSSDNFPTIALWCPVNFGADLSNFEGTEVKRKAKFDHIELFQENISKNSS